MRKMNRYPGVKSLGRGHYRIRTGWLIDPKRNTKHEIDRVIEAPSERAAAEILANERAAWLSAHESARPAGPRLLADALAAWYANKRPTVKPSTASTYGSAVAWWSEALGDYLVEKVEPSDVRDALLGAREGGDASETLAGRLRVLRTFARETGCTGVVDGVRVERDVREDERIEDEGRGLSLDELRRFLAAGPLAWTKADGEPADPWRRAWALVATMAWTGLRFGEASALEWKDIDLDACTIRVRRAQWRGTVGHPKARASKRLTVIPEELAELLHEHRRVMIARQARGLASGLVFPSRRSAGSGYVTNLHARKAVLRVCAAAGIELGGRPAVHCLRHTFNNLLRQNASELVRQAMIGHADETSGKRYSAAEVEERRGALGGVVRMIRGEKST